MGHNSKWPFSSGLAGLEHQLKPSDKALFFFFIFKVAALKPSVHYPKEGSLRPEHNRVQRGEHKYPFCKVISLLRVAVNLYSWAIITLVVAYAVNCSQGQGQTRKRLLRASSCFEYYQHSFSIDSLGFNPRETSEMLKHQRTENITKLIGWGLWASTQKSLQQQKSRLKNTKFGSTVDGVSLRF